MKYRSKSTEIEALRFDGTNFQEIYEFAGESVTLYGTPKRWSAIAVHTVNGTLDLLPEHYLIKEEDGFYPCSPDTFAARWEEVGEAQPGNQNYVTTENSIQSP